jgi:TatA/E family protein of Tat protein translocase
MSGGEILVIIVVILVLFGADKMPEMAGAWVRECANSKKQQMI